MSSAESVGYGWVPCAVLHNLFGKILVFSPVTMPPKQKKNALRGHRMC